MDIAKLKLTKTQKTALNALMAKPDKTITMEELIQEIYGQHPPASPRQAVADAMMKLRKKTEGTPFEVVRVSELGPGRMAVYQISADRRFPSAE